MRPSLSLVQPTLAVLVLAASAALLLMPVPADVPAQLMRASGLIVFAVGFWATAAIPEVLTAIIFFLIAMLFAVAPPEVVFSGFASAALWLVFGGLFIGAAVQRTGLGESLAQMLVGRIGRSYLTVLIGLALGCIGLSFLMPSVMGRVLLLVPIVVALSDRLGYGTGSRGRAGLVMVTLLATYMPSCAILPSNVPNMVLAGAAETNYGLTLTYGRYFLLHFPVMGALRTVLIVALAWLLFREPPQATAATAEDTAMSGGAKKLLLMLLVALAFWITDFVHHISAAWVALALAVVLLLPRIGLLPMTVFNGGINFGSYFLVAAILGVGAVVGWSGLGTAMGEAVVNWLHLAPGEPFRSFMALSVAWIALGMVFTVAGLPAVLTPFAEHVATVTGLPLETILMTQVNGYASPVLPYQMGPLILGIAIGGVRASDGARIMLPLTLLTVILILPIDFLWWRHLGYLG
ncbi:di/tricarboxylate transporter [Constrictibacter sp. MBR-5]|jgi:di/tricarboxylate transporter|uniref:SLC13 family permease n=1 Tax=Constrictibacter sp. MBR-5 TaxID=3156467 RepID=UPI00339645B5